ncbi:ATP-binding domain-containing protein [Desulfosporosinus fructosivorans]|uniref:ATP-binding domain-containing protein n=1 Tax=Desulfosporosinus fructosivorans TaxID=2018669 RepID=UPI003B84948B
MMRDVFDCAKLDKDPNAYVSYCLKTPVSPHLASNLENVRIDLEIIYNDFNRIKSEFDYLAYATTIHKSQGSEYQIVVAPLTMQHYVMLQRNLLYTCVTRAKKVFVLVGTKKAISMAVRNNKTSKRNTRLAERLSMP